MRHIDDPGQMTADQRFHETAAILARGFLRSKKRATSTAESGKFPQNPPKSGQGGLEVSRETRLTVQSGKVNIETSEADTTTREGAGWGSSSPTIRKATVELTCLLKATADAVLAKLEAAAVAGTVLEGAFLTGAVDTAGSRGIYGEWMIASFNRDEEIEGAVPVAMTLKLHEYFGYTTDGTDPS